MCVEGELLREKFLQTIKNGKVFIGGGDEKRKVERRRTVGFMCYVEP